MFRSVDEVKSDRTKLLIHGFMNIMQTQLFGDKNNNPYYNISTLIINICIWFYHEVDRFFICGPYLKINEKGDAVTCVDERRRCSVFGTIGIDLNKTNNMIYRWNLKITKFAIDGRYPLYIGIASTRFAPGKKFSFFSMTEPDIYFAIENDAETSSNSSVAVANNSSLQEFGEGDLIKLELNTKDQNLSFYVNDINQGILYSNIDKMEYFLALSFRNEGDCVVITDFIETYIS